MTVRMRYRGSAAILALAFASAAAGSGSAQTSSGREAPASNGAATPHFMIRAFRVKGNHLVLPGAVEAAVYPFMGPDRTPSDVEHARASLQAVFAKAGYATVAVSIPEQSVDSGIIELDVVPQTIGRLTIIGGHRTSQAWIKARAPSLEPGAAPNFQRVQQDIVALNQTADRRVTPEVKAGTAPGTIDVDLKVEDSSPLHGSLEFNNDQSPETTKYRVLGALRYDDLWGRGDSLSVSAQTAPERPDDATVFSGNYLMRLGKAQALLYYVHSDSDVAVVGGTDVVGKGDMAGFRLVLPLSQSDSFYQSITAGIDYKDFGENVKLGADQSTSPIIYWPGTVGWRGDWTLKGFKADASLSTTFGFRGLGDGQARFDAKRYDALPNFVYVRFDGSATADLPFGAQLWVHPSGQWSQSPLISNEQFSLGGLSTVRGYDESEVMGDWGAALQTELRSPQIGELMDLKPVDLRVFAFGDLGYAAIHDPLPGQMKSDFLSSVGGGARAKLFKQLNGEIDLGAPLLNGPDTFTHAPFARFRIWDEF